MVGGTVVEGVYMCVGVGDDIGDSYFTKSHLLIQIEGASSQHLSRSKQSSSHEQKP